MNRKCFYLTCTCLFGILTLVALFSIPLEAKTPNEKWTPYIPEANQVELASWKANGTLYVNVSIAFADSGFRISSWGTPIVNGNSISVDSEIWEWSEASLPVITTESHVYIVNASPGENSFTFKVWGQPIKSATFVVPEFPSFLILQLFMITTLLAAILHKGKSLTEA